MRASGGREAFAENFARCGEVGAAVALVRAVRQAVASGTQLRLVVPCPAVRRALTRNGLDRLVGLPVPGGGHRR
jgi:hypothetical protein